MDGLENMLQKGDLILVRKRPGIIPWLIRTRTKSEYSHSAIYVGDGQIIESDIPDGVIKSPIKRYDHYDVYRNRLMTPEKAKEICDWLETKLGYKYDYMGVAGIFFDGFTKSKGNNPFDEKGRYWCFELSADAYINNGFYMCVDSNTLTVTSNDLTGCGSHKYMFSYDKEIKKD